ncbi:CDP-alcohol phosphatidyltransferase family protein [Candidatus Chromulinivorax destructor]|uniref:CDP-diacylglycerol--glycerol-3-phosphate 3-phosphatidyltransferase n=1 Tax=Candidatus Chromulinivorax destructor TaxID=2066483 RepID=A0A345ZCS7_9BACT|nr:CDP-alcohol phosphatidyltransferase family protein [Candidatus Chromulinivorax destructor]AXK61094.1 hypothetical protein C0J27_05175 [Candidatus Chromulinivorax destructor]
MNYLINFAVAITLLRIFLTPLICSLIVYHQWMPALWLTGFAALTDFLDGYCARRYQQETEFGKMLDPVADKFFIFFVLAALYYTLGTTIIPSWFMVVFVVKELLLIVGALFLVYRHHGIISPSFISKIITALLMIFMMYVLAIHCSFFQNYLSSISMDYLFQFFAISLGVICVDYGYKIYKLA